ncbi:hypothetical protein VTI28DRAFT_2231 [Corynascus sepedonium]
MAFRNRQYHTLFSWTALQDSGFHIWYRISNDIMIRFETENSPLPRLVPECSGVVLELGPGPGNQLRRFDRRKIARLVGIESNARFAPDLEASARAAGLEDVYDIVTARIEDAAPALERLDVVAGSVDTVLSVQVLCSVADQARIMELVYGLLKPGGKFIFWEHTRNSDPVTRVMQSLWNPLWTRFIGGCCLTRDTISAIKSAGEWENFESIEGDEQPWTMMPRVWGVLVKAVPA